MAFNAKSLTYNKEQPSFLRKLKAEYGGDRHNVQIGRPKKDRLKTGDADEDEPTIVDEHGENLGKEEWEERLRKERDGGDADKSDDDRNGAGKGTQTGEKEDVSREKQTVADVGASKKRKVGKLVGEGDAGDGSAEKSTTDDAKKADQKAATTKATVKKKAKRIKLSFDVTEEG